MVASYAGDSIYNPSISASIGLTEHVGISTVAVTPPSSSITTAQALTVTIAVNGGTGNPTPTGSVVLTSGSYSSASWTLSGGSITINIPAGSLATGTDTLMASYSGDGNYYSAVATVQVTVTAPAGTVLPTVTVAPSAAAITDQQTDSVTVSVTGSSGQATPTGTVSLAASGGYSAQQTLAGGTASFSIPAGTLSSGANTLTASYAGDGMYATATGTTTVAVFPVVAKAPTPPAVSPGASASATVTLTASTTYAGTMNLTCTLAASPSGAKSLPTCRLNPASVTITSGGTGTSVLTVNTTAASNTALLRPFPGKLWGGRWGG